MFWQLLPKTATEPWANMKRDKKKTAGWLTLVTRVYFQQQFFVCVMLVITFLML